MHTPRTCVHNIKRVRARRLGKTKLVAHVPIHNTIFHSYTRTLHRASSLIPSTYVYVIPYICHEKVYIHIHVYALPIYNVIPLPCILSKQQQICLKDSSKIVSLKLSVVFVTQRARIQQDRLIICLPLSRALLILHSSSFLNTFLVSYAFT